MPKPIPPAILDILRAAQFDTNIVRVHQKLDGPTYKAVARVLDDAGGKWNHSVKGHIFPPGGVAALRASITSGASTYLVKERQAFYTPEHLAREVALRGLMGRPDGIRLLEPSAGGGALIEAARRLDPTLKITGVEIDPHTAADLNQRGFNTSCLDFLEMTPVPAFDVILMNPPFAKDQDLRHVQHAYSFLRPGGKLVALISPGFTFSDRGERGRFSAWLKSVEGEYETMPEAQFGRTKISVVLVSVKKPQPTPTATPKQLAPSPAIRYPGEKPTPRKDDLAAAVAALAAL